MNRVLVVFGVIVLPFLAFGEATTKFSGYAYVDYFNHLKATNPQNVGLNGFQIRRLYFTYDYAVKPNYKARFRLEANDGSLLLLPGAISGVRFERDQITGLNLGASVFSVFVKDAFIQWDVTAKAVGPFHLNGGIQSTPSWGALEEEVAWKYRSLEKTVLDRYRLAPARDLGFGIRGALGREKKLGYWLLIGNDTTSPELNKQKRFYGLLSYQGSLLLGEVYGDFRQQREDKNEMTAKALLGIQTKSFAFAGVGAGRWKRNARPQDPTTQTSSGFSLFGRYAVSQKVEVVGRGDWFDPDRNAADDASLFGLLGVAYHPIQEVDFIPNVLIEQPEKADANPTLTVRLTTHYRF